MRPDPLAITGHPAPPRRAPRRALLVVAATGLIGAAGCLHTADEIPWPTADMLPPPQPDDGPPPPPDAGPPPPACPGPPLQGGVVLGGGVRTRQHPTGGQQTLIDRVTTAGATPGAVMTDDAGRTLRGMPCH